MRYFNSTFTFSILLFLFIMKLTVSPGSFSNIYLLKSEETLPRVGSRPSRYHLIRPIKDKKKPRTEQSQGFLHSILFVVRDVIPKSHAENIGEATWNRLMTRQGHGEASPTDETSPSPYCLRESSRLVSLSFALNQLLTERPMFWRNFSPMRP